MASLRDCRSWAPGAPLLTEDGRGARDYSYSWGGAGFRASASAIALFGDRVMTPGFLSVEAREAMWAPATTTDGEVVTERGQPGRVRLADRRLDRRRTRGPPRRRGDRGPERTARLSGAARLGKSAVQRVLDLLDRTHRRNDRRAVPRAARRRRRPLPGRRQRVPGDLRRRDRRRDSPVPTGGRPVPGFALDRQRPRGLAERRPAEGRQRARGHRPAGRRTPRPRHPGVADRGHEVRRGPDDALQVDFGGGRRLEVVLR